MNYAINTLQEKIDTLQEQLCVLKSRMIHEDFELMEEYYLIQHSIENKRKIILELTQAIEKLITNK